ncbi:phosphoadenylyl-sulfate reductase [Acuticoccus sp. M5D2P5]|uniref:phosphoadenylyl-sulfate reductase n=1 Tax=Acuticoccus kalidii TaxID=2910977 RepID=UPI001F25EEC7|nr:phosphoadenylyl-sulfate reductase [Acuticoccus kalidii]MCF3932922.1 phosphoadenylyl-sulfate reductase [Acuticoccus kalidii]
MLDIPGRTVRATAADLDGRYGTLEAEEVLREMIDLFGKRIALVSSFGADSVVLLHLLSKVAPDHPVLFLQTGMHFEETLRYRTEVTEALGLTNVIDVEPLFIELSREDPAADLHQSEPDACCALRKVRPLSAALQNYDAWITGRRRHQTFARREMPVVEPDGARIKVNPLAAWDQADIDAYIEAHDLPRHPLVAEGYPSIGCAVCTRRPGASGDARDGRWNGFTKTECGIHFSN